MSVPLPTRDVKLRLTCTPVSGWTSNVRAFNWPKELETHERQNTSYAAAKELRRLGEWGRGEARYKGGAGRGTVQEFAQVMLF